MAKDELDLDEFEDDLGLDDELAGLGLGDEFSDSPSDDRNAESSTLKNTATSFVGEFADDKLQTTKQIMKSAVPSSLSKEAGVLTDSVESIKEEIAKAGESVRKEARSTFSVLKKFVPEGNDTINGVMEKIGNLVGGAEDSSYRSPSKEELEKQQINSEIIAALGEKEDSNKRKMLLDQQIEFNRAKSQIDVLSRIAGESTIVRKFQTEATNAYQRKSLELKYKSLFLQKNMLEVTKTGFDLFKNQLESIVKNTSLPETVKIRNSERLAESFKTRASNELSNTLYETLSPGALIKKNFGRLMENLQNETVQALQNAKGGLEGLESASDQGLTTPQLIAMLAGDLVKEKSGEYIGKKIDKNDNLRGIRRDLKLKLSDIPDTFNTLANESNSDMLGNVYRFMGEQFRQSKSKNINYTKQDVNDSSFFDKRTHNSINKVIPMLLAKILAVNTNMMNGVRGNTKDIELSYNHVNDKFETNQEIKSNTNKVLTTSLSKGFGVTTERIITDMFAHAGPNGARVNVSDSDAKILQVALMKYVRSNRFSTNPINLSRRQFLKFLPESMSAIVANAIKNTIKYDTKKNNNEITDSLISNLSALKSTLPDLSRHVKELEARGKDDVLTDMNILDKALHKDGTYSYDNDGLTNLFVNSTKRLRRDFVKATLQDEKNAEADARDKTLKERLTEHMEGGYTGDGAKHDVAGVAHKGEFYFTKKDVSEMLQNATNGNFEQVNKLFRDMATEVGKKTEDTKLKRFADTAVDAISSRMSIESVAGKDGMRVLRKRYDLSGSEDSFETYVKKHGKGIMTEYKAKQLRETSKAKLKEGKLTAKKEYIKFKHQGVGRINEHLKSGYDLVANNIQKLSTLITSNMSKTLSNAGKLISSTFKGIETNISEGYKVVRGNVTNIYDDIKENGTGRYFNKLNQLGIKTNNNPLAPHTPGTINNFRVNETDTHTGRLKSKANQLLHKVDQDGSKTKYVNNKLETFASSVNNATSTVIGMFSEKEQHLLRKDYLVKYSTKMTYDSYLRTHGLKYIANFNYHKAKAKGKKKVNKLANNISGKMYHLSDTIKSHYNDKHMSMLKKTYVKKYVAEMSFEEFVLKHGHLYIANFERHRLTAKAGNKLNVNGRLDNINNRISGLTGSKYEDRDFDKAYEDLTKEEQDLLRYSYLSNGDRDTGVGFDDWLADVQGIRPPNFTTKSKFFLQTLNPMNKVREIIDDRKNLIEKRIKDKLEGKTLKTLSSDDLVTMRLAYLDSREKKEGLIHDFDEWLEMHGYRRPLTGGLKSMFKLKNILKVTRRLDRKIAGSVFNTGKNVVGNTGKLIGYGGKVGALTGVNTVRGLVGLNKLANNIEAPKVGGGLLGKALKGTIGGGLFLSKEALKGTFGVGKTIAQGLTGGEDIALRTKTAFNSGKVYDELKDNPREPKKTTLSDLLNYFKNKDKKEDKEESMLAKKKAKEAKKKSLKDRFLGMFRKDAEKVNENTSKKDIEKTAKKGISSFKTLGMIAGIGMLLKSMNINVVDVVKGVKGVTSAITGTIGSVLTNVADGINYAKDKIRSVTNFLGITDGESNSKVTTAHVGLGAVGAGVIAKKIYNKKKAMKAKVSPEEIMESKAKAKKDGLIKRLKNKIIPAIKKFKGVIVKKLGKVAGKKLIFKLGTILASLAVPIAGAFRLAYYAGTAVYHLMKGAPILSSISLAVLGFDLFNDDDIKDKDGKPIKPDDPKELEESKVNANNNISGTSVSNKLFFSASSKPTSIYPTEIDNANNSIERMPEFKGSYKFKKGALDKKFYAIRKEEGNPTTKGEVLQMLDKVAVKSGVKAGDLKTFAMIESSLNPYAIASTSSAEGLFQFTDKTWNDMLKKYGKKYGLSLNTSKFNAEANSYMGAEYLKENTKRIRGVKKDINLTDLYLAHFLGGGGARQFLKLPNHAIPARSMRKAAKANRSIFYNKGVPRTKAQIYALLNNKVRKNSIGNTPPPMTAPSTAPTDTMVAKNDMVQTSTPVVSPKPKTASKQPTRTVSNDYSIDTNITKNKNTRDVEEKTVKLSSTKTNNLHRAKTKVAIDEQLNVQKQMLDVLGDIKVALNSGLDIKGMDNLHSGLDNISKGISNIPPPQVINNNTVASNDTRNVRVPGQAINLKRNKYSSVG